MLKAIMYHYVRPDLPDFPYFRYLHVDDFCKQLEYLGNEYGFVGKTDFFQSLYTNEPTNGVILTFDDGFSDHFRYVLPELLQRDLWGIFYIPTSPLTSGKLLDVHRIHLLIGKYGGSEILTWLRKIVSDDMLTALHVNEFHTEAYRRQKDGSTLTLVKRMLNYFIDYKFRQDVLNKLMLAYFPDEKELAEDFYMTKTQLSDMHRNGMVLGSHTVNHHIMSKLSVQQQQMEIVQSFRFLESITLKQTPRTFCYPYGGFHTFTTETEDLLVKNSCLFSFNVEHRDIDKNDLMRRRHSLPRYDCNNFPYGCCRHILPSLKDNYEKI